MKNRDFSYVGLFSLLIFLFSLAVVGHFVNRMSSIQLSNLESGLFAISLSAATTSFSILISIVIANLTLARELKTYGKLATRRIIQSIKSCKVMLEVLCIKKAKVEKEGFSNKEAAVEFLDNIVGQVNRLMSTIFDSREDWKDILKEESKQADELNIELGETFVKYVENQKELEEAKNILRETQGDKTKIEEKVKELEETLKKMKEELAAKKKKIESMSNTWPTGPTGPAGPIGSGGAMGIGPLYSILDSPYPQSVLEICAECGSVAVTMCSLCHKPLCYSCANRNNPSGCSAELMFPVQCKDCEGK